jgi:hypothetical protein
MASATIIQNIKGWEGTIKCIIPAPDQRDWSISDLTIAAGLSPYEKDKP